MAQLLSAFELVTICQHFSRGFERGGIDEMVGLFVRLNERFDRSTQQVVAVAGTFQECRALIRRQRDGVVKKVLYLLPVFGD